MRLFQMMREYGTRLVTTTSIHKTAENDQISVRQEKTNMYGKYKARTL